MSAYKRIQCSIIDKEALLAALKELGLTPAVYDSPQALRGFQGDSRNQTAEIIVDRRHLNSAFTGASNDLGFRFDEASGDSTLVAGQTDERSANPVQVISDAIGEASYTPAPVAPSESGRGATSPAPSSTTWPHV